MAGEGGEKATVTSATKQKFKKSSAVMEEQVIRLNYPVSTSEVTSVMGSTCGMTPGMNRSHVLSESTDRGKHTNTV